MRTLYIVLIAALGALALGAGRVLAINPRADAAGFIFFGAVALIGGLVGALLLGRVNTGSVSQLWPVRMARLWAQAKEADLKKRATGAAPVPPRQGRG